ncbi:serine hydrolase domain-containing protein [Pseudoalteromonas rubra]|uniref:Serine hydrolase n=1 Tax=Pseudoalteromonas rubra TaxID=43658 RepID=A0A5S3X0Y5_9GAMM|nr:serine hydrolase domain-containing protein [Pseudoalteromonas rubra]TMP37309.1 serine hydrolase [Pseudoalteromonas rubra]
MNSERLVHSSRSALMGFLTFLMLTSAQLLANEEQSFDEPAHMHALVEMLQSTKPEAIEHYVDLYFHPDALKRWGGEGRQRYIGWLKSVKHRHQSMQVHATLPKDPDRSIVRVDMLSKSTELIYTVTVNLSNEKPHKVTGLYLTPQQPNILNNDQRLTKTEIVEKLSRYINKIANNGAFSGTVLLADRQGVLYQSAKGLAERRFGVPNNLQTKFNLGSMSKMFTGVSVLQLVEAGKLSLQDPVVKYLDRGYFGKGAFEKVTIAHLLSHTSGLGYPDYPKTHPNDLRNLNDHLPFLKYLPLTAEPGTRFRYSNEGMILLGLVIESITQESYDTYVKTHIFDKAGMPDTGNYDIDGVTPNMAMGYFYSDKLNSMQSNWFIHAIKGNSAGGSYSTIKDLHAFSKALTSHKLLSNHYSELAYSAKPEFNSARYGYGFGIWEGKNGKVIGHSGAFIGVSAEFRVFLDKDLVLIILGNQDDATTPVLTVADYLIEHL